jgi:hypothetical protein
MQNGASHENSLAKVNPRTRNISKLKYFVVRNYPPGTPLQVVFVDEDDILNTEASLAKLPIWLKLSAFTKCKGGNVANW